MYEKFLGFFISVDEYVDKIIENIILFNKTYMDPLFATTSFTLLFVLLLTLFLFGSFALLIIWRNKCEENFRKNWPEFIAALQKCYENNEKCKKEINEAN